MSSQDSKASGSDSWNSFSAKQEKEKSAPRPRKEKVEKVEKASASPAAASSSVENTPEAPVSARKPRAPPAATVDILHEDLIPAVIGKAGATIARIREESGARVYISGKSTIVGIDGTPEQIEAAKKALEVVISRRKSGAESAGPKKNKVGRKKGSDSSAAASSDAAAASPAVENSTRTASIRIEALWTGRIVGKDGVVIDEIRAKSGATVDLAEEGLVINISGPSGAVSNAQRRVLDVLDHAANRSRDFEEAFALDKFQIAAAFRPSRDRISCPVPGTAIRLPEAGGITLAALSAASFEAGKAWIQKMLASSTHRAAKFRESGEVPAALPKKQVRSPKPAGEQQQQQQQPQSARRSAPKKESTPSAPAAEASAPVAESAAPVAESAAESAAPAAESAAPASSGWASVAAKKPEVAPVVKPVAAPVAAASSSSSPASSSAPVAKEQLSVSVPAPVKKAEKKVDESGFSVVASSKRSTQAPAKKSSTPRNRNNNGKDAASPSPASESDKKDNNRKRAPKREGDKPSPSAQKQEKAPAAPAAPAAAAASSAAVSTPAPIAPAVEVVDPNSWAYKAKMAAAKKTPVAPKPQIDVAVVQAAPASSQPSTPLDAMIASTKSPSNWADDME